MDQYERESAAARALAGDPNPTDADPLEYVQEIAEHYAQRDQRPGYVNQLADELSLDDVRTLRLAGEAAQAATPRVIMREANRGKHPRQIADEIGLTESRVYGIIREERRKAARFWIERGLDNDAASDTDPRESLARLEADLANTPEKDRAAVEQYLADFRKAIEEREAKQRTTGDQQ
ncbi:hypothetical protein CP973_00240 [Streptomyces albofaciens JCM 4342]|nr:hypothetical protein CP973_39825 [Streptomyces albofaciens JCM 4342]KAA6220632.1 hypothetical protein CP973_00240 [Streptomyces albofaciens JCM 4342]